MRKFIIFIEHIYETLFLVFCSFSILQLVAEIFSIVYYNFDLYAAWTWWKVRWRGSTSTTHSLSWNNRIVFLRLQMLALKILEQKGYLVVHGTHSLPYKDTSLNLCALLFPKAASRRILVRWIPNMHRQYFCYDSRISKSRTGPTGRFSPENRRQRSVEIKSSIF